uniref:Retrovirus-related Pol polyprotein from transposon TNT 1-94-like beta-barrel domain-containing protein n=1 Tax=Physcomitrium patens TaxID=3218 RepID=A0A2K1IZM8_PHYPA|nr:hypothetical protein PHYPA_022633 [Physcomitrium patens]
MCHELEGFVKYIKSEDKQVIYLGDDTTSYIIKGHGDVNMKLTNGDEKIISNVFHILGLVKNLFSTKQLDKAGGEILIRVGTTIVINKFGQTIAICKLNPDLYELEDFFQLSLPNDQEILLLTNDEVHFTLKARNLPTSSRPTRIIQPTTRLLESIQAHLVSTHIEAPNSIQEAMERVDAQEWQQAINAKITSLNKNNT